MGLGLHTQDAKGVWEVWELGGVWGVEWVGAGRGVCVGCVGWAGYPAPS